MGVRAWMIARGVELMSGFSSPKKMVVVIIQEQFKNIFQLKIKKCLRPSRLEIK